MIGKGNDCLFPLYVRLPKVEQAFARSNFLRVRCGHCINCKMYRSMEWCIRLECESQYWKDNIIFVTLTYSDEHLPINYIDPHLFFSDEEIAANPDLNYLHCPTHRPDHVRNFIKRLRKRLDHKIKYFAVGEYGTRRGRSHMHLLIFGLPFTRQSEKLIDDCWRYGHVNVRPFFTETCTYIAGYIQKKLYGDNRDFFKLPEFMRCSQHLGERWLMEHIGQIDDDHPFIVRGKYKYALPRQFRRILVCLGVLKESSLVELVNNQVAEYDELNKHLVNSGISASEFFRSRISTAVEKERRKLNSRNKTGDI